MVRIINYQKRQAENGKEFFVLEISGGLEMVKSQVTNQFYATSKKAFLPSTFDEQTCIALIGTEMAGYVVKQDCEPYDYLIKETGEVIRLAHKYVYELNQDATTKEDKAIQKLLADGILFLKMVSIKKSQYFNLNSS
ncbi:hypothetical protein [Flavobacterium sp. 102]|uniref:hypothetical protein n=1 Tax=Flavobacterium sp. 102 TaxID=2135623 RepID=UPI000EB5047B|nr:hypothetical protein [Flavobacterium sp. 102]RKS01462.1 hypothetical protein C8C84_1122 [Flavobacterium sp. 102]